MSPKYSVIVAENKGFSSRNYLGLFVVDLGHFCHFLPGLAISRSAPNLLWSLGYRELAWVRGCIIPSTDVIQLTLTLKMIAQVVETSVNVNVNNNSSIQDYGYSDDETQPTFEMTPGFKPFT